MNFLRNVTGQRNQEYSSDTPHSFRNNNHNNLSSTRDDNQSKIEAPQAIPRVRFPLLWDSNERRLYLLDILNLHMWKALIICFTTILLFGAQLRDLFLPKTADLAVDIVFLIVVCFFWVDIMFRMDCETNYFRLYLFSSFGYSSGIAMPRPITSSNSDSHQVDSSVGHCCGRPFHIGSFLFWCDIISTLALVREITLVDLTGMFDEARIDIRLDDYGMPADVSKKTHFSSVSKLRYMRSPRLIFRYKDQWPWARE